MATLIKERYEILELLAIGGEGRVVKALDRRYSPVSSAWVTVIDLRTGGYRTLAANLSTAWIRGISLVAGGSEIVADAFDGGPRVECRLGHDQRVLRRPARIAFGNGARPRRNDRDRRVAGRGVASFDLTGVRRLGQEVTTNARLSCAGNTYGPCDAVSPHTNLLADTRSDGTVEIVNLRTLHRVEISPDHNGPDDAVTWLPDGRTVVDGGLDGHVTLWDVKTGRLVRTLRFSDTVQNVAASPDARLLAVQTQGARSSDYASSSSGSRPATYSRLTPWQTAAARSS